jgi:hypothetical protein
MSLLCSLAAFGLRQVLGDGVDDVVSAVADRFRDHSLTLPNALRRANDRAWQSLGVALAGDGLLDRVRAFLASGDDKGVREQVAAFLRRRVSPGGPCSRMGSGVTASPRSGFAGLDQFRRSSPA